METVNAYTYDSEAFHKAFAVFLENTDEKVKTRQWLEPIVQAVSTRQTFVDAGAGEGGTTAWIAEKFAKTIAIEPNPSLRTALANNCPGVEVWAKTVMEAPVPLGSVDFVLCGHVFYYIDDADWDAHLDQMASWLKDDGLLILTMQHHLSDCMQLHGYFCGRHFDLTPLTDSFQARHGDRYVVQRHVIPIQIVVKERQVAYMLAEFMLNLLPLTDPPARDAVDAYIEKQFRKENGEYRFSSDQVSIQIYRKK